MTDSDSSLSSPPSTDDEMPDIVEPVKPTKPTPQKKKAKKSRTILSFFNTRSPSPVRKKKTASPPHEMVPEDNPDIAFIVMFRSRFTDAFPPKSPHVGPQDLERGVAEPLPSSQIESLLCALLGIALNRKKPVEKGHYGRALEEAIQTQKSQWPKAWGGVNPLSGGRSFNTMSATERLTLLKTLALWSLATSEVVNNIIKETYKSRTNKEKNDTNIPLSVQPWGRDGDHRRYWLIEGQDDTAFRIYRESNPKLKNISWWSVAGSIDEIRTLAQKLLDDDGTREAKQLSERMLNAIPRFEATEVKRKRREYRLNRDAAFKRPDPGFSLYEGRTRGKRMKYTFSDEEEEYSDALDVRRSMRQSGRDTPAVPSGPTVTASGRHVRSRASGLYGESLLSGQTTEGASPATGEYVRSDNSEEPQPTHGRSTRANASGAEGWGKGRKHIETYNSVDEMDDEDDASTSGGEWDGGDDDEDQHMDVDDEDDIDDQTSDNGEPKSLVVLLRYPKGTFEPHTTPSVNPQEISTLDTLQQSTAPTETPLSPPPPPPPSSTTQAPAAPNVISPAATQNAHAVTNGFSVQHDRNTLPPLAKDDAPSSDPYVLPKLESAFPAGPPPPYAAPKDIHAKPSSTLSNPEVTSPFPVTVSAPEVKSPFRTQPLPTPSTASTYQ